MKFLYFLRFEFLVFITFKPYNQNVWIDFPSKFCEAILEEKTITIYPNNTCPIKKIQSKSLGKFYF